MKNVKTLTNIALIIALYYIVYYIYVGIINPIPAPGDSWDYHIPISQTILDGRFLFPHDFKMSAWYFPGSSEAINLIFIFLRIPLTFSNILATIILFFSCWKLALAFRLKYYYGLLFALTFITVNAVIRWQNAVSIDMWVGVFYTLALTLLESPRKHKFYFAKLGFVLGMLIGSKYSVWYYLIPLTIFYFKKFIPLINISRFVSFLLPFSIFGLFWYIRNFIYTQNPFYPLPALGFKGVLVYKYSMWNGIIQHPLDMLNAGFGEYKIWIFSILIAFILLIYYFIIKRQYRLNSMNKLFLIGLLNFFFFLSFPTSEQTWIMVSSFRYSYPVFIPLILGTFLLAERYKKEELIGYIAIASMINILSMAYYPKLLLIYLPLALVIYYILDKKHFGKSLNPRKKMRKVEK